MLKINLVEILALLAKGIQTFVKTFSKLSKSTSKTVLEKVSQ